jgi:hypothetical protein
VYRGGTSTVPRHYFLMGHANTFSGFLIWASFEYIFINYKKLSVFNMAVIWLVNITFYSFTYTNTGLIVLTIVSVLIVIDKLGKGLFDKLFTFLARYVYIFCAVFFPFLAVIYTELDGTLKEMWHIVDNYLTGRIWYGAYVYDEYGYTILGVRDMSPRVVLWQGRWFRTMTIFDNYYLGNFLSYGLINTAITIIALFAFGGKMENKEKIFITIFAFYGIMSSNATNLVSCFALFIIGKYLYPDTNKINN